MSPSEAMKQLSAAPPSNSHERGTWRCGFVNGSIVSYPNIYFSRTVFNVSFCYLLQRRLTQTARAINDYCAQKREWIAEIAEHWHVSGTNRKCFPMKSPNIFAPSDRAHSKLSNGAKILTPSEATLCCNFKFTSQRYGQACQISSLDWLINFLPLAGCALRFEFCNIQHKQ